MSTFVATVIPALLLIAALVIDGAAVVSEERRAEAASAEIARFATDATVLPRLASQEQLNAAFQRGYAEGMRQAQRIGVNATLTRGDGGFQVEVHSQVETVFLKLIGIETIKVTGSSLSTARES